jgi:hypothetical protein
MDRAMSDAKYPSMVLTDQETAKSLNVASATMPGYEAQVTRADAFAFLSSSGRKLHRMVKLRCNRSIDGRVQNQSQDSRVVLSV